MHPHNQYGKNFIQVNFFKSQTDHVWRVTNSSWNRQPPFSPKPTFQNYIIRKMWYFCSTFSLFTYKFKEMASNFFNSWPILCISCILRYYVAELVKLVLPLNCFTNDSWSSWVSWSSWIHAYIVQETTRCTYLHGHAWYLARLHAHLVSYVQHHNIIITPS
jgi:hypothetical protein